MSDFVPRRVDTPYHFDIAHDRRGLWTARERAGLAGGVFLTRKAALRFALAETGGDRDHVRILRGARRTAAPGDAR